MQTQNAFYDTIVHLRLEEEAVVFTDKISISALEERLLTSFLQQEYEIEKTNYPFDAPEFQPETALWAAKMVYYAIHLHFFRQQEAAVVKNLFIPNTKEPNAAQMLSADIVLRFLLPLYLDIKQVDFQDVILQGIEDCLKAYHYSAIGSDLEIQESTLDILFQQACFRQLYLDRVTKYKSISLAKLEKIDEGLKENFGNYSSLYWLRT